MAGANPVSNAIGFPLHFRRRLFPLKWLNVIIPVPTIAHGKSNVNRFTLTILSFCPYVFQPQLEVKPRALRIFP